MVLESSRRRDITGATVDTLTSRRADLCPQNPRTGEPQCPCAYRAHALLCGHSARAESHSSAADGRSAGALRVSLRVASHTLRPNFRRPHMSAPPSPTDSPRPALPHVDPLATTASTDEPFGQHRQTTDNQNRHTCKVPLCGTSCSFVARAGPGGATLRRGPRRGRRKHRPRRSDHVS